MAANPVVRYTVAEWTAEGERRFGPDMLAWRFECPSCGNIAAPQDFRPHAAAGATPNSARSECIGRYTGAKGAFKKGDKPCNYAGYGLFQLSPVRVIQDNGHEAHCFGFAPVASIDLTPAAAALPELSTAQRKDGPTT